MGMIGSCAFCYAFNWVRKLRFLMTCFYGCHVRRWLRPTLWPSDFVGLRKALRLPISVHELTALPLSKLDEAMVGIGGLLLSSQPIKWSAHMSSCQYIWYSTVLLMILFGISIFCLVTHWPKHTPFVHSFQASPTKVLGTAEQHPPSACQCQCMQ